MDRSYIEDDPEERDLINEVATEGVKEKSDIDVNPLSHMDFYQADPFPHCQTERMYEIQRISYHVTTLPSNLHLLV